MQITFDELAPEHVGSVLLLRFNTREICGILTGYKKADNPEYGTVTVGGVEYGPITNVIDIYQRDDAVI